MSQTIKTSVCLTPDEKKFLEDNHISLTKFLHHKIFELRKSNGSDSNPQPLEDQPGESGGSNVK